MINKKGNRKKTQLQLKHFLRKGVICFIGYLFGKIGISTLFQHRVPASLLKIQLSSVWTNLGFVFYVNTSHFGIVIKIAL